MVLDVVCLRVLIICGQLSIVERELRNNVYAMDMEAAADCQTTKLIIIRLFRHQGGLYDRVRWFKRAS